jgi:hypothetical protein
VRLRSGGRSSLRSGADGGRRPCKSRLPLLFGLVALKDGDLLALRALGMFAVRGVALPPQVLKASGIVGELREDSVTE